MRKNRNNWKDNLITGEKKTRSRGWVKGGRKGVVRGVSRDEVRAKYKEL